VRPCVMLAMVDGLWRLLAARRVRGKACEVAQSGGGGWSPTVLGTQLAWAGGKEEQ